MTVFKAFIKVMNKYKWIIILYTVMLVSFGGINISTEDNMTTFTDTKPDVLVINLDEENGKFTQNLVEYIKENMNIVDVKDDEQAINDALFYRDVNCIIYIPENYNKDVISKKTPVIDIKKTGDYYSSLSEIILSRYLKAQSIYVKQFENEDEIIEKINETMSKKSEVQVTSKIDTDTVTKVTRFFNFASYSIMAIVIYIICIVLASFHVPAVNKRNIVSSMNYKLQNWYILLASILFALAIWLVYNILGVVMLKESIFNMSGIIYILNMLIFTICSLTFALFVSTLVTNKNAITGIVNVVALGSAFLCGAFIPTQWLPSAVLKAAHILPAYWYVNSNDTLSLIENVTFSSLKPILVNMAVLIAFSILFILLNNIISRKKQRVG